MEKIIELSQILIIIAKQNFSKIETNVNLNL